MQKRQAAERAELSRRIPGTQAWREWLQRQAERGDEAAKAALRGIRYREQRKKNLEKNGIEGDDLEPLRPMLARLKAKVDSRRLLVHYVSVNGRTLFTDSGPRIDVHDQTDETVEAALRLATQKFGGVIEITGSAIFRERAARMAARLGIRVRNEDLKRVWELERTRAFALTR